MGFCARDWAGESVPDVTNGTLVACCLQVPLLDWLHMANEAMGGESLHRRQVSSVPVGLDSRILVKAWVLRDITQ